MNKLIKKTIPLHDKNWFKTGGAAQYCAAPQSAQEFQEVIQWAQLSAQPITLLGQGANVLISDAGIKGLIIRPALTDIIIDGDLVTAGAGVDFGALIDYCLARELLGLEEFSGIPGSVGGSVFINIHYFEFLLSHFLVHAEIIDAASGALSSVDAAWFKFGYNSSTLHQATHYLVSATFKLRKASALEAAYARGRAHEIRRHRAQRYPVSHTCGSFFRNFYPTEVTLESNGKKLIWVAYYLDKIGIKGQLTVGDAIVSHQHANMLVNRGKATTADLITLARTMQERVFDAFGLVPQPECRLLGFDGYPLLHAPSGALKYTQELSEPLK